MHANEQKIRDLIHAFQIKDLPKAASIFAPDVVWRFLGTEFISNIAEKTHRGLEALASVLTNVDSEIKDYKIEKILEVEAGDRFGVSWVYSTYVDAQGANQEMEEVWVYHFSDGRISEVWDYNRVAYLEKLRTGDAP